MTGVQCNGQSTSQQLKLNWEVLTKVQNVAPFMYLLAPFWHLLAPFGHLFGTFLQLFGSLWHLLEPAGMTRGLN